MAKSYYAILCIASDATPDEIHSAYRRLAKKYHPDHYSGGRDAFQEVQEAYSVLGDSKRRSEYDRGIKRLSKGRQPVRPYSPTPEPLIPRDEPVHFGEISLARSFEHFTPSHDEIFDWLWRNFSDLQQPKSGRIQGLTLEVPLTFEQARRGGLARVTVPTRAICPLCRGHGRISVYECSRCAGEGALSGEMPVYISFPPGVTKEHAVMVPLDRFGIRNLHITVLFRVTAPVG
jgi:DnaJ-class molecular chaperone